MFSEFDIHTDATIEKGRQAVLKLSHEIKVYILLLLCILIFCRNTTTTIRIPL